MEQLCYGCMNLKKQHPVCEHCGFSAVSNNLPHQLPIGMILQDQYVVGRVLGQGGFGITYIGWDQNLKRKIAIKEYYPQGMVRREQGLIPAVTSTTGTEDFETGRKRFLMEAQTLAKLQDVPEIAKVYNFFSVNGTAYIVMEYVEGITLEKYVRQQGGKLAPKRAVSLLRPVMKALAKVHRSGIIHRDISPDNIMIQKDGSIRLLDFGTARDTATRKSITQAPILKHGFAPMEQYQVNGTLGPWTDEYALCATLYYCMTGYKPMEAPALLMDKKHIDWESIPGLEPGYLNVLKTATAMNTEDRYPNMEALLAAFDRAGKTPVGPTPAPTPKKKPKWLLPVIGVAAAAVLALAILPKSGKTEAPVETESPERTAVVETQPEPEGPASQTPVQGNGAPMLMSDNVSIEEDADAITAPAFGTPITRQEIYTITFLDSLDGVGADAWDVSEKQNGLVMAWVEPADVDPSSMSIEDPEDPDETQPQLPRVDQLYHLYIAGNGGVQAPEDCMRLFMGYCNLTQIQFNGCFFTDKTTDMRSMFDSCFNLEALDLSSFDTSQVEDMNYMFYNCYNLTTLHVNNFNTSNVTSMVAMFYKCRRVTEINVSSFDVSRVTEMNHMFFGCTNLMRVDVRAFDTRNVTTMKSMFSDCNSLREVDVSRLNTSNVENMSFMFGDCYSLTHLDVSGFDTSRATTMESMFDGCRSVKALDVSNFDTSHVENFSFMFYDCGALTELNLSSFDTSKATTMCAMFYGCGKLVELDLSNFDTSNVTEFNHMFYECYDLVTVNLSSFNTSKATTLRSMFCNCESLQNLDVSHFNTANVTDVSFMFSGCADQQNPSSYCARWDLRKVTEYKNFLNEGTKINGRPWLEFFT